MIGARPAAQLVKTAIGKGEMKKYWALGSDSKILLSLIYLLGHLIRKPWIKSPSLPQNNIAVEKHRIYAYDAIFYYTVEQRRFL